MKHVNMRTITIWCAGLVLLFVLAACANNTPAKDTAISPPATTTEKNNDQDQQEAAQSDEEVLPAQENETHEYTTADGEVLSIPTQPQRIVYTGTILGDLLALNLPVVGSNLFHTEGDWYYADLLDDILDVGNPGDLEVITSLDPDLIIDSYANAERREALKKISNYVPFNSALPYYERVKELGRILDMEDETTQWLNKFSAKSDAMWDKLQLQEGETATIFLQLGKTLYVMGNRSLGAVLYIDGGFAIPEPIKTNIIDESQTFLSLSEELIHEYAGDHLFVLSSESEESQTEIDQLVINPLWQSLPAVQAGQVYYASTVWNSDNLLILDLLLEEIPVWMGRE